MEQHCMLAGRQGGVNFCYLTMLRSTVAVLSPLTALGGFRRGTWVVESWQELHVIRHRWSGGPPR